MSLKVWLPLNGDLENRGCSDLNNFSYTSFTLLTDGKIGNCCSGLGIYHIENEILQNEWSICAWVKSSAWSTVNDIILCKNTSSADNCLYYFSIINGASLNLGVNGGSSSAGTYSYTFATDTWYHVAATYNGNKYALYINGTQVKTGIVNRNLITGMNNIGINCRATNTIGTYATGSNSKKLNDVRIYDHCLSTAEVKEISLGLILHYKLDNIILPNLLPINLEDINNWVASGANKTYDNGIKFSPIKNERRIYINCSNVWTENGGKYTVSLDAKADTDGCILLASRSIADYAPNFILTTTWAHYSGTITLTGTSNSGTLSLQGPAGSNIWIRNVKVEKGEIATPYVIGNNDIIVEDSSGYNNNGVLINNPIIINNTNRYSNALSFSNGCYIKTIPFLFSSNIWTVSCWYYETANPSNYLALFCLSKGDGSDSNKKFAACPNTGRIWYKGESGSTSIYQLKINEWAHLILSCDGTTNRVFLNGSLIGSFSAGSTMTNCNDLVIGARANSSGASTIAVPYNGYISDFRIYCTALSEADIKQLYNTNLKIDDKHNIHTFTIEESNLNSDLITKTGNLKSINFNENGYLEFLHYDKEIYTEPDGSKWVHVFHHNNPAAIKFDNTNQDWLHGKYMSADAWYDLEPIISNLVNYEFLYRQKITDTDSITTYRWTQPIDPVIATWVDVSPSSGNAVYNTSTGYTNSNMGGMYLMKSPLLHMCIANTSNGNWFGGLGVSTAHQGGIPGFPNTVVTTGCIDLYVRIYLPTKLIKDKGISTLQYIEK